MKRLLDKLMDKNGFRPIYSKKFSCYAKFVDTDKDKYIIMVFGNGNTIPDSLGEPVRVETHVYNKGSILSDARFDSLREYLRLDSHT